MKEEIFGPILPIIPVADLDSALNFIKGSSPLALYLFTNHSQVIDRVLKNTVSGGVCVNDCAVHNTLNSLPFGGVGESGIGSYHGKSSFDTFSHKKSIMWRGQCFEMLNQPRYPPTTETKLSVLKFAAFQ